MRLIAIALAVTLTLSSTFAYAQTGAPSGRESTTGDPVASSATPGTSPTTGSSMRPGPSGSGTSASGGSDANGDQGRDKMSDSSQGVRPLNKQNNPTRSEERHSPLHYRCRESAAFAPERSMQTVGQGRPGPPAAP
jgi:hypothetical protein